MSRLQNLSELGQSIWYDNIRRALIESGELEALRDAGVRGVTSNPSIFEKAIGGSADYDAAIEAMSDDDKPNEVIYEALAIDDIQMAADIFRPVYDATMGMDGYVSLEVSPTLAHDTSKTVSEAHRLWTRLDRPNVMIKVPATPAGIPAIEQLIGAGINVNVTLLFSTAMYEAVAEAYINGLKARLDQGHDVSNVSSVASFFVSRVDTAIDARLTEIGDSSLQGTIAIANTKVAYSRFASIYSADRWKRLADAGARVQRLLWASTGTKNPLYSDTLYVDELIGAQTVNTVPPATLNFFLDHGTVAPTLEDEVETAKKNLQRLAELDIDLESITQELLDQGVESFAKAFDSLIESVAEKRARLRTGKRTFGAVLGPYENHVRKALQQIRDDNVMRRIWQHDHMVWKPDPTEIVNRLGWLHAPENMRENLDCLMSFVGDVRGDRYTHAVLLGMGGSSLAAEGFYDVFGRADGTGGDHLQLRIIDSTDPDMIAERGEGLDLAKTLFIVATKSGGTVETLSAFKHFYNQVVDQVGRERAGRHFIAITDPGSGLNDIASQYGFRDTFLNDPNIGGRYSALSYFGLVPAALVGVDLELLLERALTAACNAESANCPVAGDNTAARLGVMIGELAKEGRDKLTIVASERIATFGDWVEQLIAESTGKDGTGILPVVGEPLGKPEVYGDDRVFVYLRLEDDDKHDAAMATLIKAGHPTIRFDLRDVYDLGAQYFVWEMATAVTGSRIRINPFDQPNVEAAKVLARSMVQEYKATGALPHVETAVEPDALETFLSNVRPGNYIAIQAYVHPTEAVDASLRTFRSELRDRLGLATTVGYGPRFLHSTGQLHKGDGGNGLFIQLTSDSASDLPIPDEAGSPNTTMSFGVLKLAQALGDAQALLDSDRRLIRFDLERDVVGGIERLSKAVSRVPVTVQ